MRSFEEFTAAFGIHYPIIQAPMAGVSTPRLAAAVSNAGGLGSISIGAGSAAQGREMIEATRALTTQPFNVNVFCHAPARRDTEGEAAWIRHVAPLFAEQGEPAPAALGEIYKSFLEDDDAFDLLLAQRPAVVSFHFGVPPAERIAALKQAGIRTMATATSLDEARLIEAAGIDAIVAQGIEAGGHRGMFDPDAEDEGLGTAALVRLLATRVRLPVIAAGGIMDGAGICAALALGASAVQLGTAFILCPESAANAQYRARLHDKAGLRTRLTSVLSGRPARGIANRLVVHGEQAGSPLPPAYPVAYDLAKRLNAAAAAHGVQDFAVQWAGQGAPLARALTAADLVRTLVAEWQDAAAAGVVA